MANNRERVQIESHREWRAWLEQYLVARCKKEGVPDLGDFTGYAVDGIDREKNI